MRRAVPVLIALVGACGGSGHQTPVDGDVAADVAADDAVADASPIDGGSVAFAAAPTALSFNAVVATTARDTVVFTNSGGVASAPVTLSLGGAAPARFAIEATTCTGVVAAGATCSATVAFTPTAAATSMATATLTDGAASVVVPLTGFGTNTLGLTVTPTVKDYGMVGVGATSSFSSFTVKNVGTATTGALTVALDSGATGDFVLANNLCAGATVAAQGTCTFSAALKPTTTGTRTASVRIADPTSTASVGATVTGSGTTAGMALVIAPATYAFGTVVVGDSSLGHQFTVTNLSGVSVGPITTSTGGPNVGDFLKMADNCNNVTLAAGTACTLFVAFEPGAAGARTAHVSATAATGGTATADLSGTGQ